MLAEAERLGPCSSLLLAADWSSLPFASPGSVYYFGADPAMVVIAQDLYSNMYPNVWVVCLESLLLASIPSKNTPKFVLKELM